MREIGEYFVVIDDLNNLQMEVISLLKEGWQPYGELQSAGYYKFYQVMVRYT